MVNKTGKVVFDLEGRRSKVIRRFLEASIRKRWVWKWDVFDTFKHNMQFNNIFDYLDAIKKADKEKAKEAKKQNREVEEMIID